MSNKKMLFELHGFKVMSNSIYLVADKIDYNAPTGFQQIGVTKLPSEGVGNTYQCPYKRISKTDGIWDSGFYELSPCYQGKSKALVSKIVEGLLKDVVEPYRSAVGKKDALSEHNQDFFDKHSWQVYTDKRFNTSNPIDVVALYFALLGREVVPKKLKGDATFADTPYLIIDVDQKVRKRDEDASKMFEAIGVFEYMFKKEKPKLDKILYYLGKNLTEDTSKDAYRGMFKNYLENGPTNTEKFNNLVEKAEKEQGMAEIEIYYHLKSKELKTSKVTKTAGYIYYEDTQLGVDLKSSAARVAKDPELSEIKKEILFSED